LRIPNGIALAGSIKEHYTMTEEKCTIKTVDFKTGTCKETLQVAHDTGIPQILRDMAQYAAKNGVEAVLVITIEAGNVCYHFGDIRTEHHAALMALYLEDIREELKNKIFNEGEDEEGDGAG
jgi:hypothetical protein